MKKIAYIELDTHAEIAANFMRLAEKSTLFQADYYFSAKIMKQLQLTTAGNVIETIPSEILKTLRGRKYDLVIIGTAHRFFSIFRAIMRQHKTAVIVHNRNFSKAKSSTLFANIFKEDFAYRLKLLVKEGLLSAPALYRSAAALFVLDKHLEAPGYHYMPLFFTSSISFENNAVKSIVVPGTVSQQRRNYAHIFSLLKTWKAPLKITFLGKAEGIELEQLQLLKVEVGNNVDFTYFTEKIPAEIFGKKMKGADLLWCPVEVRTNFFSVEEFYGSTKMSGNVGDAISFGKPAVFPATHPQYEFTLDEDDLYSIIACQMPLKRADFRNYSFPAILKSFEDSLQPFV